VLFFFLSTFASNFAFFFLVKTHLKKNNCCESSVAGKKKNRITCKSNLLCKKHAKSFGIFRFKQNMYCFFFNDHMPLLVFRITHKKHICFAEICINITISCFNDHKLCIVMYFFSFAAVISRFSFLLLFFLLYAGS